MQALVYLEGKNIVIEERYAALQFEKLPDLAAEIAKVMGLIDAAVAGIHADGAGCYGHNGAHDAALDAAPLARHCSRAGAKALTCSRRGISIEPNVR